MEEKKKIKSFRDLEVYQNTYRASIVICREILPNLPDEEKYNLKDQLRRSCTSVPPLIAEGFAKKHQKRAFQKYLDDAIGECNETVVHLSYCRDLYCDRIKPKLCEQLIDIYDKSAKQMNKLIQVWNNFKRISKDE